MLCLKRKVSTTTARCTELKNMIFIVELLNHLLQFYIFFTPLYACLPLQRIASFTLINIVENTRIIEIFLPNTIVNIVELTVTG